MRITFTHQEKTSETSRLWQTVHWSAGSGVKTDTYGKLCLQLIIFLLFVARALQAPLTSCSCWWPTSATTSPTCRARCTVGRCPPQRRISPRCPTAGGTTRTVWTRARARTRRSLRPEQAEAPNGAERGNRREREQILTGIFKERGYKKKGKCQV